jgi:hypothetical protein
MAFVVDNTAPNSERSGFDEGMKNVSLRDRFYSFQAHPFDAVPEKGVGEGLSNGPPTIDSLGGPQVTRSSVLRKGSTESVGAPPSTENKPALASNDLWEFDDGCFNAAMEGDYLVPVCDGTGDRVLVEGRKHPVDNNAGRVDAGRHRRASSVDAKQLAVEELEKEKEVFNERLHGYVRQSSIQSPPPN